MKKAFSKSLSWLLSVVIVFSIFVIGNIADLEVNAKEITVYSQTDSRWGSHPYGYSNSAGTQQATISSGGCGILAYVNAVYYLNGQFIEPVTLADWSVSHGYRVNGVGTSLGLYKAFADAYGSQYGIKYSGETSSYNTLRNHLNNGGVAVGSAPNHLMAIVDYDNSSGKFLILDSYKSSNRHTYSNGYTWETESSINSTEKLKFSTFRLISSTTTNPDLFYGLSKVDKGTNFYGMIIRNENWAHLSDENGDVRVNDNGNIIWYFTKTSDGGYKMQNVATGKYLDVSGAKDEDNNNVQTWEANDSAAQVWYIYGPWSGEYVFKPKCTSNKVLNVYGPTGDATTWTFDPDDKDMRFAIWDDIKTYTISYNMNGGGGSIGNQTKVQYSPLTLSGVYPTRDGYAFVGWDTDPNATTAQYQPNSVFNYDDNVTLFAIWKEVGYTMSENEAAGQTIPDGDYYIVSEIHQDYFVDIPGNDFNTYSGQNVQMWGWGSSLPPKEGYDCFHFEYLNNGFYKIRQINTNMCLDVAGGSLDNGTNVQMCEDNGCYAQQWSIEKTSHGYRIRSRCNAYYLDVVDGKLESGTNVRCWSGNDSKAQSFGFIPRDLNERPISDGTYVIRTNVNRDHILDVSSVPGQFYPGANVQIYTSIGNTCVELYSVQYVGDGWYKIFEKTSGLIIEFANPDTTFLNNWDKPRNVQLAEDNGGKNQLWKIRKNSDGTYFVINKANGYYLDLENSWLDDGSNVSECTYNGSNAQRWIFEIGAYTICYNMNGGDGYIDNQIKNYGQDTILSGVYPTRTGYDFIGWNTDPNSNTAQYQPNGQFSYNGDTTLFAVWKPKQIDVTFYRNHDGNDNVTDTQTFIYGINGQFFSDKYWSKDGCTLLGWSFDRNSRQESYSILSGVANEWINAHTPNVNLYAIWRDDSKPFASNAVVDKISSRGYRVTCNIGDNVGVTKVLFAVWTDYAGQDDLVWHEGTISGNVATVYIEASQHNNESGSYSVEIYPYDANENFGYYKLENIFLSDTPQRISSVDYNKHTYVLYASDKSWTDAEAWCEQNGGYLATINNQEEWDKVKELLGTINATPCWFGAESTSGSFKWVTGEPFDFSDWHEGQPDTWDGHEFYLGTGYSGLNCYRWNDFTIAAYDIGGFVYEKPYTYTISYDSNGGEGSIPSSETYFGGKFKLAPCSFTKTGCTFANAYVVCRKSDNKWYTSHGWLTEEDISRLGYTKWSYPQEEEHTINDVWTDGASNNDTYTFYAVWDSIIDFGENFYATISETDNGMYITNTNGHFYGKEKDNSNDQIWYFEKHDNWYYIKSCSDGQYLDVLNEKDENGAKIQVCRFTNSNAQRWYIFGTQNSYYIRPIFSAARTLDMYDTEDIHLWYKYDVPVQKFTITKTDEVHNYYVTDSKDATCSEEGYNIYTCNICGKSYTENIAKKSHSYTSKVISPTTTAQGYTLHTCSVCGHSYKDNYTDKLVEQLVNNSVISAEMIKLGETVTANAKATGGTGEYLYQVVYKQTTQSKWTTAQSYKANSTVTIKPASATTYDVCIKVKDSNNTEVKKYFTVKVINELKNNSTISKTEITLGDTITVNGKATGGTGSYQYNILYKQTAQSKWTTVQSYKANATATFKPGKATNYDVCVKVKDSDGTEVKKFFTVMVKNAELKNTSTISAETINLGETVTTNAKATGGTAPYQYNVLYKQTAQTKWTTVQAYKENATVTFKPGKATAYDVCVKVKDSTGTEVKKYFTVNVTGNELKNISTVSAETINLGENITVNAKVTGSTGFYTYAVYYKKTSDTKWVTAQDFKSNNKVIIKPIKATTYDICVKVKDDKGTIDKKYFKVNVIDFVNTSAISETEIKLGETVNVNCSATGSTGFYQYAVYYKKTADTKWTTKQSYSSNNAVTIKPTSATTYDICVKVKDNQNNEAKKYFTVTVK